MHFFQIDTPPLPGTLPTVVTITDQNFVIAVFLLVLSLKFHRVGCRTVVYGIGLTETQKDYFRQFPGVEVIEAARNNPRNPCTRKAEAVLAADNGECKYFSLLDGDCIATGDITPYLSPAGSGFFARIKSPSEDASVFRTRYSISDTPGTIPSAILAAWRRDVGERSAPAIRNTVCGGNFTVHRDHLWFMQRWHDQMMKVIPPRNSGAHDFRSPAYFQVDESVLNSLLAFGTHVPPVLRARLDEDDHAHVAHLGPNHPKPWVLWRRDKMMYYDDVVRLFAWAKNQGFETPRVPWTFKTRNKPAVVVGAFGLEFLKGAKRAKQRLFRRRKKKESAALPLIPHGLPPESSNFSEPIHLTPMPQTIEVRPRA
ncbi:MAG: hypothetical protein JO317_07690 [Verrucomicrobiae bacterium]|nr:hypothetical protein [Verrucomicrobiae bacterium]